MLLAALIVLGGAPFAHSATGTAALLVVAGVEDEEIEGLAARHVLEVAGIPFVTYDRDQDGLAPALAHPLVVIAQRLYDNTLTREEERALAAYVAQGGTVVAQRVEADDLFSVFGISGVTRQMAATSIQWQIEGQPPELSWCDHAHERRTMLPQPDVQLTILGYQPISQATVLARFADDEGLLADAAVLRNRYGDGQAYVLGVAWKQMTLLPQLDRDGGVERSYSNGFEPSADTVPLFVRGVYQAVLPVSVIKHTSPGDSAAALIVTHDVDSSSAFAMSGQFAAMEAARQVAATYNITTHYLSDGRMAAFYDPAPLRELVRLGHEIGAHSVGHFPDFADETRFPVGEPGNTVASYRPVWSQEEQGTVGGTVFGETEMPKLLLERDLGIRVRVFRSGYLYWNDKQINVLDRLGYAYDSSRSANDLLTNFPFRCLTDTSIRGRLTDIYEIPMTISDAIAKEPAEVPAMLAAWRAVLAANTRNHAPTVLLVHPNREWKIEALAALLDGLDPAVRTIPMTAFGQFWRQRVELAVDWEVADGRLRIQVASSDTLASGEAPTADADSAQALIIRHGQKLDAIEVRTATGARVPFRVHPWGGEDDLILVLDGRPGDLDGNGELNLADLIFCLQIMTDMRPVMAWPNPWAAPAGRPGIDPADALWLFARLLEARFRSGSAGGSL